MVACHQEGPQKKAFFCKEWYFIINQTFLHRPRKEIHCFTCCGIHSSCSGHVIGKKVISYMTVHLSLQKMFFLLTGGSSCTKYISSRLYQLSRAVMHGWTDASFLGWHCIMLITYVNCFHWSYFGTMGNYANKSGARTLKIQECISDMFATQAWKKNPDVTLKVPYTVEDIPSASHESFVSQ